MAEHCVLGSVTWTFCNGYGGFPSYKYRKFLIFIFKKTKKNPKTKTTVSKSYLHQDHLILMLRIVFPLPNKKCHNLGNKIKPSGLIEWHNCVQSAHTHRDIKPYFIHAPSPF